MTSFWFCATFKKLVGLCVINLLNLTLNALVEVDIVLNFAFMGRFSPLGLSGTTTIVTNVVALNVAMTASQKSSFCQNTTGGVCTI
jgi:hypothetical protein